MTDAMRAATICVSKAGLTAGTTTSYTTAAAASGSIAGKFATALAAQTNTATPTTDFNGDAFTALAASRGCIFVYSIIAAGTIAIHQGPVQVLDGGNLFDIAPEFPAIDFETYLPFGYVVVKNASTGSAWTYGASNWTSTGLTDTYHDVSTLPRRPQIL